MAAFEAEDDKFAENFHTVNFNKFFYRVPSIKDISICGTNSVIQDFCKLAYMEKVWNWKNREYVQHAAKRRVSLSITTFTFHLLINR